LGLKQGDRVTFSIENGLTVLKPDRGDSNPFEKYEGSLGSLKTKGDVKAWLNDLREDD
jgi:hypothetical protein